MKCKMIVSLAAIVLFSGATAAANEPRISRARSEQSLDVTEYKFTDDVVEGDLPWPDDGSVSVRRSGPTRSLIRVRTHFVPQMLKSVEDI